MSGPRVSRYRAFAGKRSPLPPSAREVAPQGRRERTLREVLSPTRCGGSPLPEGAKKAVFPVPCVCGEVQGRACPAPTCAAYGSRPFPSA